MSLEAQVPEAAWRHLTRRSTGALCTVDEVELPATGERAALKRMHAEHLSDAGLVARCLNEALILDHLHGFAVPGIPRLYDFGLLPSGCPFLLMELLGESLASRLEGGTPHPCVRLTIELTEVLAGVHAQGIVHRDLRPENILLSTNGAGVYLIDFGLAKVLRQMECLPITTGEGDFLGTPEYMAPEQWKSPTQAREPADVYALGVILYRLMSGGLPFSGSKASILMYEHLTKRPQPLPRSTPSALSKLIFSTLAKSPADRPTAQELAQQLRFSA